MLKNNINFRNNFISFPLDFVTAFAKENTINRGYFIPLAKAVQLIPHDFQNTELQTGCLLSKSRSFVKPIMRLSVYESILHATMYFLSSRNEKISQQTPLFDSMTRSNGSQSVSQSVSG